MRRRPGPPRLTPRPNGARSTEFLFDEGWGGSLTSDAGRWRTPRVLALAGDRTVDVSADPALAPLFRADMIRARRECERRVHEAEGPCAGKAYDAARVGELPRAWRVIDAQVRRGGRAPAPNGGCYQGDEVTRALRTALAATLADTCRHWPSRGTVGPPRHGRPD